MIFYLNTMLIKNENNLFIQIDNKNILIDYFLINKNDDINKYLNLNNNYYILRVDHINKKQNLEYKYFVFLDFKSINVFNELLKVDFFGFKSIINIFNKNINYFIECCEKQNIDELKYVFKLNAKQIQCLFKTKVNFLNTKNKKAMIKENKKIVEFKQILNNLGYSKDLVDKVISQNLNLFENTDTTLKIKKFVELVKTYAN